MNPSNLDAIERNLDVPRGTLRHWLSESSLRHKTRTAESPRDARHGGWKVLRDLF